MDEIDWRAAFDFSKRKAFNADDKTGYENEIKIYQVVESLGKLEAIDEGKAISIALKQKYWSELPYSDLMGTIASGRNRSEISQRFYVAEGQPVISGDEAYRFLLNRWMEKQMQIKKKQQDNIEDTSTEEPEKSSGSGLLKKRRIGSNKRNKSTKD
jgi:hypothetical protein